MRIFFLLFSLPTFAALTTITDTLYTPAGTLFSGTVSLSLNSPASAQPLYNSSGRTLTGFTASVSVTSGAFSYQLEANDAITPSGTSYTARYSPSSSTGGGGWSETWVVPTSSGAVKVYPLRSTTVPVPSVMISPAQLTSGGATAGDGLVWNGSSWQPASIGAALLGQATLDIGSVPDGACVLHSTAITVTGAALGNRPTVGSSVAWPEGVDMRPKITGPNSVKIEICNNSGASYDPPSATYYLGVIQ
jgi:hypothetical protein